MLRQFLSIFPQRREKQLIRAAEDGRSDLVGKLLQAGGNPNAKSDGDVTVLMWAAARGHIEVIKILLESGAEPNARTRKGRTAVDIAVQEGHESVATLLRELGALGSPQAE
jgi:ankyrin repeat protein